MSPIRPALGATHRRTGLKPELRTVSCPGCGHRFDASHMAMSLRCPKCTQPVVLEDVTLDEQTEGRLSTMGHVEISQTSGMSGQVVCGQLTNDGRFEGSALVHGKIELGSNSRTAGQLRGQSLTASPGATITGHAKIGPDTVEAKSPIDVNAAPKPSRNRLRLRH